MRCQFLREAQVKFCRASAIKKMIVRLPGQPEHERCSSAEYSSCPLVRQHHQEGPTVDRCPFLHEQLVQYCAAAAVTKYVPYTEEALTRCGNDSHRYCDLFLAYAGDPSQSSPPGNTSARQAVDAVPEHLWYTPNHFWLDESPDGSLHIGLDAFATGAFGTLQGITFLDAKNGVNPTVVLTVHDVDLQLVFPAEVSITRANSYLRTDPARISADPYTRGWLFEGTIDRSATGHNPTAHLLHGPKAAEWMRSEIGRLAQWVHAHCPEQDQHGQVLLADGGSACTGIAAQMNRDTLIQLYHEFFSPVQHRRTP
jgi:glycine cleavage system H lipoate-binding protein